MPIAVEPARLPEHPAVRGWLALHPELEPTSLEIWTKGGENKPAVLRLEFADPGAPAVFAKGGSSSSLAVEREVHERILPELGVPSARYRGHVTTPSSDWIFLEDVGNRWLRPQNRAEARLAGDWLGRMHGAAAEHANGWQLPDAGAARYLDQLKLARHRIVTHHDNPGLSPDDTAVLDAILGQLEQVESQWEQLTRIASGIPPTLVHGDFQTKNLRLRERDGDLELVPLDWEMAGWGIPVVDLADAPRPAAHHQVDLGAYRAAVAGRWPHLSADDLHRLAACGHLWRRLAAIEWETTHLKFTLPRFLMKPISTLRRYRDQVEDGLERLAPWLR